MKATLMPLMASMLLAGAASAADNLSAHQHGVGSLDIAIDGDSMLIEMRVPGQDLLGFEQLKSKKQQQKALQAKKQLAEKQWFEVSKAANCQLLEAEVEIVSDQAEGDHGHDHGHDPDDHAAHDKHPEEGDHDAAHHDDHDDHAGHKEHDDHEKHHAKGEKDHHDEHQGHAAHDKHDDHDKHHEAGEDGHHDEHKGEAGHKEHESEVGHIEYHASWLYQCGKPAAITSLQTQIFASFPNSQQLKVRILSGAGQKLDRLTPKKSQINF